MMLFSVGLVNTVSDDVASVADCHTHTHPPLPCTHAHLHVYRRGNLSSDDTVNWTIQTFLVGFTSLFLLKATLKSVQKST